MLDIIWTSSFKKDYKLAQKRNLKIELLDEVIRILAKGQELDKKYLDHPLSCNWKKYRECHLSPDWLLIYMIEKNVLTLILTRTSSHADLY